MDLQVQVIAGNIANMTTTGFKSQRAEFQDLIYEHVQRIGAQASENGNILPVGIELGSGVKTVGTPRLMTQGTLSQTGNTLDVAIQGTAGSRSCCPTAPSTTRATARSRWTIRAASSPPRAISFSRPSPSRRTRPGSPSTSKARFR